MRCLIIGGGKVGLHLALSLQEDGYTATIVELDEKRSRLIAERIDAPVICGDGSRHEVLREIEAHAFDVCIAVTGHDEVNLIACQLVKMTFGVPRTVARVNYPKNEDAFRKLGVDLVVSTTGLISSILSHEALVGNLITLTTFAGGSHQLVEVEIAEGSRVADQEIANTDLPDETILVALVRNCELIIPRGNTRMLTGDRVIALCETGEAHDLQILFGTASGQGR